jgi:hypothetical protein
MQANDTLAERIATPVELTRRTPEEERMYYLQKCFELQNIIREQAGRIAELEAKVDELEVTLDDEEASGSETVTLWKQAESERDALRLKVEALEAASADLLGCDPVEWGNAAHRLRALLTPATPQGGEGAKLTQWWRCRFCQMKKHRDNCPTRFGIIECPTCLPKGYCSTLEPLPD